MVKAVARLFSWPKMLESGTYRTIEELAKAEKINSSDVSRVLRLTLLARPIVEATLGQATASRRDAWQAFVPGLDCSGTPCGLRVS